MSVAREEIFGPVISIMRTNTIDEAIRIENDNPYGNAAAVFTQSGGMARYVMEHASAGMIGVYGRIQREGEVVHLVAHRLTDLSANLAGVGERDATFPLPHGRGDEFHHASSGLDPRGLPKEPKLRNIVDPYGHIDQIKVKTRDFR